MLDPFEVMDRFGTDALRYYCFREVSFGQDGGVSTITFGERYETELANELGNLASRTTNMLGRYRDGTVPTVDVDPALAADFDGLVEEVSRAARPGRDHAGARAHLAARAAAEPLRRGERAVAAGQGPRARPTSSTPSLRSLAEGLRVVTRAADAVHPGVGGEAARRARRAGDRRSTARGSARTPAGSRSSKLAPLFPKPE